MHTPNSISHMVYNDSATGPPEWVSPCLYPCEKSLPSIVIFYLLFQHTQEFFICFIFDLFFSVLETYCHRQLPWLLGEHLQGDANRFPLSQICLCLFPITGSSLHESLIPALSQRQPAPAPLCPAAQAGSAGNSSRMMEMLNIIQTG